MANDTPAIAGEITPAMLAEIAKRTPPTRWPSTPRYFPKPDQLSATLDRLDRENVDELHRRFDLAMLARSTAIGISSFAREV